MAANEHLAVRERRGVVDGDYVKITKEEYSVLKAKAEMYDEYIKQCRYYNKYGYKKNHEDDGK